MIKLKNSDVMRKDKIITEIKKWQEHFSILQDWNLLFEVSSYNL